VYFNKDTTENRVRNDVAIFQRSMTMYHLAQEGNATDLVTGSTHAYDLKLAGVRNIHFLRFLTPKEQQPRIEAYERWQAQTAGLR
jgi:hypothetical protein